MQHCSNVGDSETRTLIIDEFELQAYQALFHYAENDIPPLFFARFWYMFELFQPFITLPITLVETQVTQNAPLPKQPHVQATLTLLEATKIKHFERYRFEMNVNDVLTVHHTFIKQVKL